MAKYNATLHLSMRSSSVLQILKICSLRVPLSDPSPVNNFRSAKVDETELSTCGLVTHLKPILKKYKV